MGHKIVLYSGAGCHLCDDVHDVLEEVRRELPFELEVRDIASDPSWLAAYRHDIPVVTIDGVEAFRHRLTAADLRAALRATVVVALLALAAAFGPNSLRTAALDAGSGSGAGLRYADNCITTAAWRRSASAPSQLAFSEMEFSVSGNLVV